LKIDRSFVSQLGGESRDREIIAAVTGMAHALGMTATAEGVETETQRDELTAIGCDAAQGYLLARPLAPDALAALWESPIPTALPDGADFSHEHSGSSSTFEKAPGTAAGG